MTSFEVATMIAEHCAAAGYQVEPTTLKGSDQAKIGWGFRYRGRAVAWSAKPSMLEHEQAKQAAIKKCAEIDALLAA